MSCKRFLVNLAFIIIVKGILKAMNFTYSVGKDMKIECVKSKQRSWVQILFKPSFLQASFSQNCFIYTVFSIVLFCCL